MKIRFHDIKWDTDGQWATGLPAELTLDVDVDEGWTTEEFIEEFGADALSDEVGFCVFGFCYEVVE